MIHKPIEVSLPPRLYKAILATWVAIVIGTVVVAGKHVAVPDGRIRAAVAAQKAHDDDIARQLSEASQGLIAKLESENEQLRERVEELEARIAGSNYANGKNATFSR